MCEDVCKGVQCKPHVVTIEHEHMQTSFQPEIQPEIQPYAAYFPQGLDA